MGPATPVLAIDSAWPSQSRAGKLVADRISAEHGQRPDTDDPHIRARLFAAAERAKQRLTSSSEARVPLPSFPLAGELLELEPILTRAEVELRWQPLLDRIRGPIARALADAKLRTDDILLVGGATRMRCIVELAARTLGRMPHQDQLKYNNIESLEKRIARAHEAINKLGSVNQCEITLAYFRSALGPFRPRLLSRVDEALR